MELKNNKDIKYLGIPNICFSLTDTGGFIIDKKHKLHEEGK